MLIICLFTNLLASALIYLSNKNQQCLAAPLTKPFNLFGIGVLVLNLALWNLEFSAISATILWLSCSFLCLTLPPVFCHLSKRG